MLRHAIQCQKIFIIIPNALDKDALLDHHHHLLQIPDFYIVEIAAPIIVVEYNKYPSVNDDGGGGGDGSVSAGMETEMVSTKTTTTTTKRTAETIQTIVNGERVVIVSGLANGHASSTTKTTTTTSGMMIQTTLRVEQHDGSNNTVPKNQELVVLQSLLQPIAGVEQVTVHLEEEEEGGKKDNNHNNNGENNINYSTPKNHQSNGASSYSKKELKNSTIWMVQVCHDAQCQKDQLLRVLQQAGYSATVMHDETTLPTTSQPFLKNHHRNNDNNTLTADSVVPPVPQTTTTSITTTITNNQKPVLVRSTFFVRGICCASEVPSVRKIIKPLPGVSSLQINIPTKHVYVQHDCDVITAEQIAMKLTQQGFPGKILRNGGGGGGGNGGIAAGGNTTTTTTSSSHGTTSVGTVTASGAALQGSPNNNNNNTVGRTTLHTSKVLGPHDIATIQRLLLALDGVVDVEAIQHGVEQGDNHDNEKEEDKRKKDDDVVVVEHDVTVISALELCTVLQTEAGCPMASLVQDGQAWLAQTEQIKAILSQPRSNYVDSTISIPNLTKRHCPILMKVMTQHYIRAQVRAVHPHVTSHMVKVEHNPDLISIASICETLMKYGLHALVVTDGAEAKLILPMVEQDSEEAEEEIALSIMQQASQLSLFVILSGIFWFLSLLSAMEQWEHSIYYAGFLSVVFGLPPVAMKAFRTLTRFEFDANCMMVIAAIGALALGEWDEAASVAFLFSISEYLEARATDKARIALAAIVQLRPEHANVIHPETKEIVLIPADRVPVGSLISVRTGDKIAADGIVVEGSSQIDESSLTGESVPVLKTMNDIVSGGGINIGSTQLVIRTTTSVEDSAVSRLIRLVEEAQANQSPTEKMIDGFARAYTPAVITIAALMCTLPWLLGGQEQGRQWTLNGLIIIVIACPCALTISTPVTYAAGLAATAQRGIVVKGGANLETLGSVNTVLFDKTGTLTEGKFKILHLKEIGKTRNRSEMLELLATMEAPSSHPLSATLVQAARNEGVLVSKDKNVREHSILKGEGVTAVVDGKQVYVGNVRLFDRIGMFANLSDSYKSLAQEWNTAGCSVGFIGVEGEGIIGAFCVTDIVRSESKEVVESLLLDGVKVKMLTGDGEGAAHSVASQVGLSGDCVHAKLLPEDKLQYVNNLIEEDTALASVTKHTNRCGSYGLLRRKKAILFCGDGVNDAPALTAADVGVSMGEGGASLAMEMSDVTLMDSNLHKLLYVIRMGRRVVQTIQENVLLSLACKLLVVVLTFAGYMTLMVAIASDVGVMLLVTLNGLKLLPTTGTEDDTTNSMVAAVAAAATSYQRGQGRGQYSQVQSTDQDTHAVSWSSSALVQNKGKAAATNHEKKQEDDDEEEENPEEEDAFVVAELV